MGRAQAPGGNQPQSTSSNDNVDPDAKLRPPKKNKDVKRSKHGKRQDKLQNTMIDKLSRQVYQLQMASYGKTQQNLQGLQTVIIPIASRPVCFDLTDFTSYRAPNQHGCGIWQVNATGGVDNVNAFTTSHLNANIYWAGNNNDGPDTGAYLAQAVTYFIEVAGRDTLDNTRVRFDVISARPGSTLGADGTLITRALPETLPHLINLADPAGGFRINPMYFKKYFSKTILINSAKTADTKGTTANIIRFSFKLKPNKVVLQRTTAPNVRALDTLTEEASGNFGPYSVGTTQPLWMIISTDDATSLNDSVVVNIARRTVFRDHMGSAHITTE